MTEIKPRMAFGDIPPVVEIPLPNGYILRIESFLNPPVAYVGARRPEGECGALHVCYNVGDMLKAINLVVAMGKI